MEIDYTEKGNALYFDVEEAKRHLDESIEKLEQSLRDIDKGRDITSELLHLRITI